MRNLNLLLITILFSSFVYGQADSVYVTDVSANFDNASPQKIGDTVEYHISFRLNFDYNGSVNYTQRIVYAGVVEGTEGDADKNTPALESFSKGVTYTRTVTFRISSLKKSGNNTVVIWPDLVDKNDEILDIQGVKGVNVIISGETNNNEISNKEIVDLIPDFKVYSFKDGIRLEGLSDDYQLQFVNLYNISGQIVRKEQIGNQNTIELRGLATGVYFVKISNQQEVIKLIVSK